MTSVIFMGTPDFSVVVLKGLVQAGYDIKAVVTQPDKPVGRKRKLTPSPVKVYAQTQELPILQPTKLSGSSEAEQIKTLSPDFIITAAFGQFLPTSVLNVAKIAAVNVHGSLLPKYRGGAPIQMSIMNGESETGITVMYMAKKMDAGDMLAEKKVAIDADETSGSLFEKLSIVGRDLLLETLPEIISGTVQPTPQVESEATFAYNLTPEQEKLDFHQSADALEHQVRALNPDPVAYTYFEEQRIKIWFAKAVPVAQTGEPGSILVRTKKQMILATGDSKQGLSILELQPAGKSKMPIVSFLNGMGQGLKVGDQFVTGGGTHR